MNARWILVADSAQARIFRQDDEGLSLQREYRHAASGEHNQDLMGNRPNLNQHPMEKGLKGDEAQSLRDDESLVFARQLAGELALAHAHNEFRDLVLIADPRFLGMLRGALKKPVVDCVSLSLDKRAVDWSAERVEETLAAQ